MTLTIELDPCSVKINQCAKCLDQKSFCSKVSVRTDRHTTDRLLYPDHTVRHDGQNSNIQSNV